jgi:hypothetical protein
MKRTVIILSLVLGMVFILQAQLEIKPAVGVNFSKLSNEPDDFTHSARVGYQLGGSLQIGKKLYLEPGVYWVKMGSEMAHSDEENLDYQLDMNAMRIPVFVGYQIIGGDEENIFGLRVFGGPTAQWVTKIEANDTKLDKDDFNSLIWGVDVGAGVDVWLLFLDLGYEWGLSEVYKEDPNNSKNLAFWANLGIRIRF